MATKRSSEHELAAKVAADLFSGWGGFKADRLVQVDKSNKPYGGWCEGAVRDRILSALLKVKRRERKKAKVKR